MGSVYDSRPNQTYPAFPSQRCFSTACPIVDTITVVSSKLAEITREALDLPDQEQLRLARTLLERSEATGDAGVQAAWEDEIERRIQSIDAGLAKSRPFAEVVAEIDRQLGG